MDFRQKLFESVSNDFINYLEMKERSTSYETKKRYLDDLNFYIQNCINSKVLIEDYKDFFSKYSLKSYHKLRSSATARYAVTNLLDFYFIVGRIKPQDYIEIKNELKQYQSKKQEPLDFLIKDDLNFLLDFNYQYSKRRAFEDSLLTPMIISLSYSALFEQNHLAKLKWSDFDIKLKRIRNIRFDTDPLVNEWIELNEKFYEVCEKYYNYRISNEIIEKSDNMISINGQSADNLSINKLLNVLNDNKSNSLFLSTRVNTQKIIRSRILNDLLETKGKGLIDFYKIIGFNKDTQITSATKEYIMRENSKKAYRIN
ncbi:hypothetical protein [Paenibacillus sp. FSL M7-1046]|uniref:hypothetical protein n=1 Tax=Paenibacillus sp. FSL M7-1046 TaxID=2975315 RepID=UPI0030F55456